MSKLISMAVLACILGISSAANALPFDRGNLEFQKCVTAAGVNSWRSVRIPDTYWQESNADHSAQLVRFNARLRVNDEVVPHRVMCEVKPNGHVEMVSVLPGKYVQAKR